LIINLSINAGKFESHSQCDTIHLPWLYAVEFASGTRTQKGQQKYSRNDSL